VSYPLRYDKKVTFSLSVYACEVTDLLDIFTEKPGILHGEY